MSVFLNQPIINTTETDTYLTYLYFYTYDMNRNWMKHVNSLDIKYTVALIQSHLKVRVAKVLLLQLFLLLLVMFAVPVEIVKKARFVMSREAV